ncbi:hypothetical protein FGIG_09637 [Fasciola gigantica]|uniref:Uncharacterized protein n=1 Tax=Fasciola gigantica TaxID=46835 RepID=A0A504YNW5_FASGI|nr:hypothetical protein FGIG_09637 [Fasciola gigantica]
MSWLLAIHHLVTNIEVPEEANGRCHIVKDGRSQHNTTCNNALILTAYALLRQKVAR